MKCSLMLLGLISPFALASSNADEEKRLALAPEKNGLVLLPYTTEYSPGPAALFQKDLYFANCPNGACNSVYRFSPQTQKFELLVQDVVIHDLYVQGETLVLERVTEMKRGLPPGQGGIILEQISSDGTRSLIGERTLKAAEASARFALHAARSEDGQLPADIFREGMRRRTLTPQSPRTLFQVGEYTAGTALILGEYGEGISDAVPIRVYRGGKVSAGLSQVASLAPGLALGLIPMEQIDPKAKGPQSLVARLDLSQQEPTILGRNLINETHLGDEVPASEWRARKVTRLTPTFHGGALLADQTEEPGELRSLWYLTADQLTFSRVLGVPAEDIAYARMLPEGILVSHALSRTIALYTSPGSSPSPEVEELSTALTKVMKPSKGEGGCPDFYLAANGDFKEIILRQNTPSGVKQFLSLGKFKMATGTNSPILCHGKDGIALLATEGSFSLTHNHLKLELDWNTRRGTNVPTVFEIHKRKGVFHNGAENRLSSAEASFKAESPLLLVFRNDTLILAREALPETKFFSLTPSKSIAGGKDLQVANRDGTVITEYQHVLMPSGTEFLAADFDPTLLPPTTEVQK